MFSIDRSGYYAWLKRVPGKRQQANEELDKKITHIFKSHHNRYGSPRITDELRADAENCSKNRVARRMRHLGLKAKAKKKFKVTTDSKHNFPVAPNLLNRDFTRVFIKLCQHKIISAPNVNDLRNIFATEKQSMPNCA